VPDQGDDAPRGRRGRRRKKASPAKRAVRNPLLRVMTADMVLRAGSYLLRQGVRHGLVRGRTADKVPDHPPTMTTRVVTAAASAVATRSVPGALLIGSGLVLRTLYRRGLARRAAQAAGNADGDRTTPPT